MKVAVLAPVEERFDGTGGAIATWVRSAQCASNAAVTVCSVHPIADRAFAHIRALARFDAVTDALARVAGRRGALAGRVRRALWLRGLPYVLAFRTRLRTADVVWIHNRPRFALLLRRLGYRGAIVLHMHNEPRAYIEPRWQDRLARDVDAFVFCSTFLRDQAVTALGVPADRSHVVYNGVTSRALGALVPMAPDMLFAGRIDAVKGVDLAIEATAVLRDRGVSATLTIIGGTKPGLRSEETPYLTRLRAMADELERRHGTAVVRLEGPAPHPEVLAAMARHPISLFPSRWAEPFGMVIAEATACGSVVIAPAVGGIPEVLALAGVEPVSPSPSPAALADAVESACATSEPERRARAARIGAALDWGRITAAHDAVLEGLRAR